MSGLFSIILILILPILTTIIFFRLATNKSFPIIVRSTAWGSVFQLAFACLWFVLFLFYHEFIHGFVDTAGLIVIMPPILLVILAIVGFIIGGFFGTYKTLRGEVQTTQELDKVNKEHTFAKWGVYGLIVGVILQIILFSLFYLCTDGYNKEYGGYLEKDVSCVKYHPLLGHQYRYNIQTIGTPHTFHIPLYSHILDFILLGILGFIIAGSIGIVKNEFSKF